MRAFEVRREKIEHNGWQRQKNHVRDNSYTISAMFHCCKPMEVMREFSTYAMNNPAQGMIIRRFIEMVPAPVVARDVQSNLTGHRP